MVNGTHFPVDVIGGILARVRPVAGRPFLIAVDGPGGSGKSTLARELAAACNGPTAVVEGNDFCADLERGQNQGSWIQRWMAAENHYLEHVRPPGPAEAVVPGG